MLHVYLKDLFTSDTVQLTPLTVRRLEMFVPFKCFHSQK